ncbi:MAG TPA: FAD-dependent oxidoreductase [candidate division Zixibacteria bacterium]|nr:FAD-dependent oxidoreductase [candidate division Zixibacteria bacterium]
MTHYKYLIIGGGQTADAAVQGIRSVDSSGTIGLISGENHPPYRRPPLSKGLWKDDPLDSVWLSDAKQHATMHVHATVTSIAADSKQVVDDQGDKYEYDKLLLATGGSVRTLPYDVEGIIYFRTLDDYHLLKQRATKGSSVVVIGGGFIGSEIAAALAMNDIKVSLIFPQDSIGSRIYPVRLSKFLNEYFESKGVQVLAKETVTALSRRNEKYHVTTSKGTEVDADVVVAGIGIQPNVDLARAAGLKVDEGIFVNENLQTSNPDIYAAGDVANFFNPSLDRRLRVEHEDNATKMGECAGKNMAGKKTPYHYLPFFYSDLFDLGYEAVGELDSGMEIAEDWKNQFTEGVVYYLRDKHVRGVLLWNTWGQVDNARKLIAEKTTVTSDTAPGLLPR